MTHEHELIDRRRCFERAGEAFVTLVGSIGGDVWDRPGVGEWSVRDLVGHASRALSTIESYLAVKDTDPDRGGAAVATHVIDDPACLNVTGTVIGTRGAAADRVIDDPIGYFRAVRASSAAAPDAVARRGREAGVALGSAPAATVTALAERVRALVASVADAAIVTTPVGPATLGAYLPTRTFELAVHSLDLARAIGREMPAELAEAVGASVVLASRIAAEGPSADAVLLALTGRGELPHGFSVV